MKLTGIKNVTVCPWGIREGVLLRYVEDGGSWWAEMTRRSDDAVAVRAVALRIAPVPGS
jgi:exopolyphosphatase/guanosine-5'-triphosphate,3'-diphosphate pyrophosphatase